MSVLKHSFSWIDHHTTHWGVILTPFSLIYILILFHELIRSLFPFASHFLTEDGRLFLLTPEMMPVHRC